MAESTDLIILLTPDQIARFWAKVEKGDPWDCWPWLGYVNSDGYGSWSVRLGGRAGQKVTVYAHRMAYALAREPIPADMEAAHAIDCYTRACCNPEHLTPKSHWDNTRDIMTRRAKALAVEVQQCLSL